MVATGRYYVPILPPASANGVYNRSMRNRDRFLRTLVASALLFALFAVSAMAAAPMTKINIVLKDQAGKPVDHASVVVRFVQGHSVVKLGKEFPFQLWDESHFPQDHETGPAQRGKHWQLVGEITGAKDLEPAWATIKAAFLQNGWTSFKSYRAGGFLEVMSYSRNGVKAWANIGIRNMPLNIFLDVIEVGPPPISLNLTPPGAEPENVDPEKGDFPYLAPLPGSRSHGGHVETGPFRVTPKGASQSEVVATSSWIRTYDLPGLANLLFVTVYKDALTKAGWSIVEERNQLLYAHYTQKGRNIWAYLIYSGGVYAITVADGGSASLSSGLSKSCHVALYGVLFDFNKATSQPVSDGVLQQVAGLLTADKALKLEVQGHTDNVGNDAYNQTLSEARARSVMVWLTQHGVAAERLTSKGYGKTKPVADNGTDDGRAKNRRVEIADPRCTAKAN